MSESMGNIEIMFISVFKQHCAPYTLLFDYFRRENNRLDVSLFTYSM